MGNSSVKGAAEEAKGNRSLNLSCKLTPKQYVKIPEELSLHVPHLKFLNLSHNQITSLPHSFSLLLHLRVLDLSYNRFRVVPEALTGLEKLHTLNLANNNITELPVNLAKLTSLEKLNISNNCLRALPGSLVECPKLHVLVTQGNELIHPPQAICDTGSAATLHFLRERHFPTQQARPTAKASIFTRVRGVQVVASVSNPESASMEYRQAQGMSRTNKLKCPLMPPACATSLTPDQLTDSLLGLLYGVAISDAMALNTEGLTVDECSFFYDSENFSVENRISDYLRTHFPPHDWSSNTDIMLLTLESMMRWGGVVDELELACQLDQWRIHGSPDLDPMPGFFLSPFMKRVITTEGYSANPHGVAQAVYKQVKDEMSRGIYLTNCHDNSCLPSSLVLGIPCFYKQHEVEMNAERICKASHSDPVVRATCIFLSLLVASLLQGQKTKDAPVIGLAKELMQKVEETLTDKSEKERFQTAFHTHHEKFSHSRCDVLTTLQMLMFALSCEQLDFKEHITRIVMQGGEGVCVHASVVGGVLGLILGYANLPQDWLIQLPQENIKFLNSKLNLLLDLFGLP